MVSIQELPKLDPKYPEKLDFDESSNSSEIIGNGTAKLQGVEEILRPLESPGFVSLSKKRIARWINA